eukprot:295966-Pyramimonas_sp.AAC.1
MIAVIGPEQNKTKKDPAASARTTTMSDERRATSDDDERRRRRSGCELRRRAQGSATRAAVFSLRAARS